MAAPATVEDIIDAAHHDSAAVTALIMTKSQLDPSQTNAAIQADLGTLRTKRQEILDNADEDLLRSNDLDAALKALEGAADDLKNTAKNMTNATDFLNNFNTYTGYINGAITTLKSIAK